MLKLVCLDSQWIEKFILKIELAYITNFIYASSTPSPKEAFMLIYHGSNMIVEQPQILSHGHFKDFGYGFYCTELENQAKK